MDVRKSPFPIRWKCLDCENYDLCSPCYNADKHDTTHSFARLDKITSRPVPVGRRCESQKVEVMGIFPGSTVKKGKIGNGKTQMVV
ncbi:E3 ubiquitin-protein ligase mib1 [Bulinus truncatus]|nr:E3 ubiquitin-protein ligase mib1 [Bulinus truncatus]